MRSVESMNYLHDRLMIGMADTKGDQFANLPYVQGNNSNSRKSSSNSHGTDYSNNVYGFNVPLQALSANGSSVGMINRHNMEPWHVEILCLFNM